MGKREEPRVKFSGKELDKEYDKAMKETATEGLSQVRIYDRMERNVYEWAKSKGLNIEELPDFHTFRNARYKRLRKHRKDVRDKRNKRGT